MLRNELRARSLSATFLTYKGIENGRESTYPRTSLGTQTIGYFKRDLHILCHLDDSFLSSFY